MKDPMAEDLMSMEKKFWNNVLGFIAAIALALGIRSFIFEPFHIPSGSMIPTLLIGDYIVVSKPTYGFSKYSFPFGSKVSYFNGRFFGRSPEVGEVAVFRPPVMDDTDFIKRVVGVPGDTVQMREGLLYLNGVKCPVEPVGDFETVDDDGTPLRAPQYMETLPNGVKHLILKQSPFGQGVYDDTPEYKVPEGHYFMMGDNRDGSNDSRGQKLIGFVPYENFIGEAKFIFFSSGGHISIWQIWKWVVSAHYERFAKGIR